MRGYAVSLGLGLFATIHSVSVQVVQESADILTQPYSVNTHTVSVIEVNGSSIFKLLCCRIETIHSIVIQTNNNNWSQGEQFVAEVITYSSYTFTLLLFVFPIILFFPLIPAPSQYPPHITSPLTYFVQLQLLNFPCLLIISNYGLVFC